MESLQLLKILGTEYTQEFVLNLHDLAFVCDLVEIFDIDQDIFYQVGLHLRRVLCIHDLVSYRRHLMVKGIDGICSLAQTFCHMLWHIPFVFVLKGMLDGCPEVHRHSPDLDLCLKFLRSLDRIYGIVNDKMITSVSALFDMFQIIFLTLYSHIASFLDQGSDRLNIFFKLADDTHTCDVFQFFFHFLHWNMFALHFLKDAAYALDSAFHLFDRAVNIVFFTFLNNVIEFDFQLSHSQFIRAQNASP